MDNEAKQNDMFLATLANPQAKPYDFLNNNVNPGNTQLLDRDYYKNKSVVVEQFTTPDGKFDEVKFNDAYNIALANYNLLSDEEYIKSLDKVEYDPFNVMRPRGAQTYTVDVKFSSDYNPFKQLYSRSFVNSIDESDFSLREIAQQGKIYDVNTNTWKESVNRLGLIDKVFGETLVYAQWDEDGVHVDPINGLAVNHKKGDWKIDPDGNLYLETLGDREIYGKQVVSVSDILTTDGSAINKALDFFDSDGKEKSVGKVAVEAIAEIAPLLIPGVGTTYGGIRAAVGLASVMPTFFKSIDSLLRGDSVNYGKDPVSKAEGWMSKFVQQSTSDVASQKLWNFEQLSSMVSSIFSQIYEQRAMAGLSKILMRPDKLLDARRQELLLKASKYSALNGVNPMRATQMVLTQSPELKAALAAQSKLSKALSLGYMALTTTGDIYGEALNSGYDRRTAGFAALLAASGQYGIMMNNAMGDWFLDETTGYHVGASRRTVNNAIKPYFSEFQKTFEDSGLSTAMKRNKLAELSVKVKHSLHNAFSVGNSNAILRNMFVEGTEEVTEQAVLDATKGIVEVMSYLGLTKDKGTFRTIERFTSGEAFQEYLANFVGGLLGGGLFEIERSYLGPWINNKGKLSPETNKSLVELIASGYKDDVIKAVRRESKYLGNNTLSFLTDNISENFKPAETISQADLIADKMIEMVNQIDIALNSEGLNLTDDEIISKAIRTELVLQGLENSKEEGKHYGIEGLIIDDFRNASVEIAKIKGTIADLEKQENSEEQIKLEKEKLKPYKETINNILSGKSTMKYFDQMLAYLDPDIKNTFGSLDIGSFTKAKYDVEYNDLPVDGIGVTKKSVDAEWDEFLSSTDIKKKLEIITNSYKELEKTLNPTISSYIDSGYADIRDAVYKNIVDIQRTIGLFNTTSDPKTKQDLLTQFININNQLDKLGISKVSPWTVYNIDIFNRLKDLGLIQKTETIDGQQVTRPYTQEELNTIQANGKTLEDNLKENFNNYVKIFPNSALNLEDIVKYYNDSIKLSNQEKIQEINKLRQLNSSEKEIVDRIAELENSINNVVIADYTNSPDVVNLSKEFDNNIKSYFSERNIADSDYNNFVFLLQNQDLYKNNFDELIAEFGELNNDNLNEFIRFLDSKGLLDLVNDFFNGDQDLINKFKQGTLDRSATRSAIDYIKDTVNRNYTILNNKELSDAYNYVQEQNNLLKKNIEENKPEIFKIGNVAFDFLLDVLENQKLYDKELYNQLYEMAQDEFNSFIRIVFPGAKNFSMDEAMYFADDNNFDKFYTDIASAWEEYYQYVGNVEDSLETFLSKMDLNEELRDFFNKHYNSDTPIGVIMNSLLSSYENRNQAIKTFSTVQKFMDFNNKSVEMKSNPLYDFIRSFTMVLNSNPKSNLNKIFDILRREELNFKASSGASNYISEGIRDQDLQQAINTLLMIKTVLNKMSTTSYEGTGITGFIAMRQKFAELSGISDDVSKLKTLSSDQAKIMSNDIDSLIVRLQFLKDLALMNSTKIANEDAGIKSNMDIINLSLFEDLLDTAGLEPYIPDDLVDILNSEDSDEVKLFKAESSFYNHNKGKEKEALAEILKHLRNFSSNNRTLINRDIKRSQLTSYDKAIYFATVLSIDSKDYNKLYLSTIEGRLNKAPFYMQELASKIVYASTKNPELFASIYDLKINDVDKDTLQENSDLRYITLVLGGAGTGKTAAITPTVLDMFRQTNASSSIWLAAPNTDRVNDFHKDVIDSIGIENISLNRFSKKELFSKFGDSVKQIHEQIVAELKDVYNPKNSIITVEDGYINVTLPENFGLDIDFTSLPNLLAIDEITHFSTAEAILLEEISRLSLNKGKFMKVVGLGDPTQMGYTVDVDDKQFVNHNINGVNAVFSPDLVTSIRATNDQKRFNLDLLLGLVNKAVDIFKEANIDTDEDRYIKASNKFKKYLSTVDKEIGLKYYLSEDNLKGDYITNSIEEPLRAIKKAIDNGKINGTELTLGILSKGKTLDPVIEGALTKLGLLGEDYINNIVYYTVDNVQGSESDYFIFNTDLIKNYDKNRDTLRAFYTYTSRSKTGTVIYDPNDRLKSEFYLSNAPKSQYPIDYEIVNKTLIDNLKKAKIDSIKKLLNGDYALSEDAMFKWMNTTEAAIEQGKVIFDAVEVKPPSINLVDGSNQELKKAESNLATDENFGIMLHSFYNNPNAVITENSITTFPEAPNTDLNGLHDVDNYEDKERIVKNWTKLKYSLLHNMDTKEILVSSYKDYFNFVFGDNNLNNITDRVSIEYFLTASKYRDDINKPFGKFGDDPTKRLSESEPLINLSAKLSYKGQVHYVTLSTLSAQNTLEDFISRSWKPTGDNPKLKKDNLVLGVRNTFNKINQALQSSDFIELIKLSKEDVTQITSTRLLDIRGKNNSKLNHYLHNLSKEFPGMTTSEIRWYPSDLNSFKSLINKYTFGEKRSDAVVQDLYKRLKNRPYIVVSFDGNLDSSSAKLVPIGASSRKFPVMIQEIMRLNDEFHKQMNTFYEENVSRGQTIEEAQTSFKFDPLIDAKFQTLLNRSQILDILILWAQTPISADKRLIDLFYDTFTIKSKNESQTVTILDVLSGFRGTEWVSIQGFAKVLEAVKNEVALEETLSREEIKKSPLKNRIISKIEGISIWHLSFYNLFIFEDVIKNKEYQAELEAISGSMIDENALLDSASFTELKDAIRPLFNAVSDRDMDFYYSIPISVINEKLSVNPQISGVGGFSKEIMSDKFFINVTPEPPRFLVSSSKFLSIGQRDDITAVRKLERPKIKPENPRSANTRKYQAHAKEVFNVEYNKKRRNGTTVSVKPLEPLNNIINIIEQDKHYPSLADKIEEATKGIDLNDDPITIINKVLGNMRVSIDNSGNINIDSIYNYISFNEDFRKLISGEVNKLYNNLKELPPKKIKPEAVKTEYEERAEALRKAHENVLAVLNTEYDKELIDGTITTIKPLEPFNKILRSLEQNDSFWLEAAKLEEALSSIDPNDSAINVVNKVLENMQIRRDESGNINKADLRKFITGKESGWVAINDDIDELYKNLMDVIAPTEEPVIRAKSVFDIEYNKKLVDGTTVTIKPLEPFNNIINILEQNKEFDLAEKIRNASTGIDLNDSAVNIINKLLANMQISVDDSGNINTSDFYRYLTDDKAKRRLISDEVNKLYNNLKECK